VAELFPDPLIHIGHDEPPRGCWMEDAELLERAKQMGFPGLGGLQRHFLQRVMQMVERLPFGKEPIVWAEPALSEMLFVNDSKHDGHGPITQSWLDVDHAPILAQRGFRVIESFGWYLDGLPGSASRSWQHYYERNPSRLLDPEVSKRQVLGGEACAWELDESTAFYSAEERQLVFRRFGERVWHNLVPVAERLWSRTAPEKADDQVTARVASMLERLQITIGIENVVPLELAHLLYS